MRSTSISAAFAGISKAIELVLKPNPSENMFLELLNSVMRLPADLQEFETFIRRSLIFMKIATLVRGALKDLSFDDWLFAKD